MCEFGEVGSAVASFNVRPFVTTFGNRENRFRITQNDY